MNKKKELFFLFVILVVAGFFRLWQLDSIPPGLYPDVAINGNEAISEPGKVFYPENNGREGLFINLIAFSFVIFGPGIWSIKIVAAAVGILTVLGVYLLAKELLNIEHLTSNIEQIALLSSFFLATSFWHTNFSRIGFRAILVPFILVFAFYFLFKGLNSIKSKKQYHRLVCGTIFYFVLAGIFFGLGFYTYTPFRLAVLILPFILIPYLFIYKKQGLQKKFLFSLPRIIPKEFVRGAFYFLLSIFIIALPIGIYFIQHPGDFIGRAAGVSVFAQENPIKSFLTSTLAHLAMFNFYGDQNWRHSYPPSPMLPLPLGILFLIGLVLSVKELKKFRKHRVSSSVISHLLLVIWFIVMLLPGALTYEGIPHALRTIGVLPVVYIFAALGTVWLFKKLRGIFLNRKLKLFPVYVLFISILLSAGFGEFYKYFYCWGKNPKLIGAFSENYVAIGNYLNSLPPNIKKYVIVNQDGVPVPYPDGIPMPAQTAMFMENAKFGRLHSVYLLPKELEKIKIEEAQIVIIPLHYDNGLFNELREKFPEGEIIEKKGVWIYEIY